MDAALMQVCAKELNALHLKSMPKTAPKASTISKRESRRRRPGGNLIGPPASVPSSCSSVLAWAKFLSRVYSRVSRTDTDLTDVMARFSLIQQEVETTLGVLHNASVSESFWWLAIDCIQEMLHMWSTELDSLMRKNVEHIGVADLRNTLKSILQATNKCARKWMRRPQMSLPDMCRVNDESTGFPCFFALWEALHANAHAVVSVVENKPYTVSGMKAVCARILTRTAG
jgi:hypothetical protein